MLKKAIAMAVTFTVAGGVALGQDAPKADRPLLFCDRATIESLEGPVSLRQVPPRLASQGAGAAPKADCPTVIRDGEDSWKFYGHTDAGLVYAESRDGMAWEDMSDALRVPPDARQGFTPFLDEPADEARDSRYKALGGSVEAGGLFALASSDGKTWRKLADKPVIVSTAREAFLGRNAVVLPSLGAACGNCGLPVPSGRVACPACGSHKAYVAFFSELRDGKRTITRSASRDFIRWESPERLALNAEGEDLWSATVFRIDSNPPLLVALLTRTAAGQDGPADICLATSRDDGRTFDRLTHDAWVRPEAGATTWRAMVPSAFADFRRSTRAFGVSEKMFYAGGQRYEIFNNRFVALTARAMKPALPEEAPGAWDPAVIVTKPFTVAGNALELNVSTDSTGGFRCEILDENGNVIPGYSREDCIRSTGIGAGYTWVSVDPAKRVEDIRKFRRPIAGDHYGDSEAMLVAWRAKKRELTPGRDTMMVYMDGDIGDLIGKTVKLRIIAHGADVFSFATVNRRPVEGEVVDAPAR